jgi:nicotinamidase-related amidase
MASKQPTDSARQEQVLSVALEVFGRFGFRKTSMDEVARSADISRQGLYLYFASKEDLFRAAVRHELDTALTEASRRLDEENVGMEERVVAALDAWMGRFVGSTLAADIGNMLEDSAMQLGDMAAEFSAAFETRLSSAIAAATTENDRRQLGITPEAITGMLHAVGKGWQYKVESRSEFVANITSAVRLVFAGFYLHTTQRQEVHPMTDSLPTIDPRHTALLVMDFQAMAIGAISEADALLTRVADAIAIVRGQGGHIAYVRVAFEDAEYDAVPAHSMMAPVVAAGRAIHSQSPTTAVHDHLAPEPGDIIVRKTRVGAFSTTDLDVQLRDRDITALILAGIITSGVVLATVLDAHDRDYQVFVLADASADLQSDVHDFLIEKIFPRRAQVITIADLATLLSAG